MNPVLLRFAIVVVMIALGSPVIAQQPAAPDTTVAAKFGGFVDGYYAYDFNRPAGFDRAFTTQPARSNEFNVNLAYVEASLGGERLRGRLALQAGTSVQSNYAGEPSNGSVSGPSLARNIQEAFVGYRIAPTLWVDGGVFYSNVGMESWVSRDNPTYTRSLVADYSPYYSSGVKLTWQATTRLTARLDVVNGWQNISETNTDKAVGARLDFTPTPTTTLSYYSFFGNEIGGRLRVFNGVGFRSSPNDHVQLLGEIDLGSQQESASDGGSASWYGVTFVGRVELSTAVALSGRFERYEDNDQVIIVTGSDVPGFRASGGSIGLDIVPQPRFLWRTELRGLAGKDLIFPNHDARRPLSRSNAFVVTSLALTF